MCVTEAKSFFKSLISKINFSKYRSLSGKDPDENTGLPDSSVYL